MHWSRPDELYFPILTKNELEKRLGKFWPPTAVHLRDMDWGSIMRCAFSVEMDGWEEGRDALGAHAALQNVGLGRTANECKRIQEVGAWILDTMWTIVMVNAGMADPKVQ